MAAVFDERPFGCVRCVEVRAGFLVVRLFATIEKSWLWADDGSGGGEARAKGETLDGLSGTRGPV
jgi:hypothetical protein